MGRTRLSPSVQQITDWKSQGLTYKEIAERWEAETGNKVNPRSLSMVISRQGRSEGRKKHPDLIPWQPIWSGHNMHYHLVRLRWLGRRRAEESLPADVEQRLDKWLRELSEARDEATGQPVAIAYDYDLEEGFVVIPRDPAVDLDMGDGVWLVPPDVSAARIAAYMELAQQGEQSAT